MTSVPEIGFKLLGASETGVHARCGVGRVLKERLADVKEGLEIPVAMAMMEWMRENAVKVGLGRRWGGRITCGRRRGGR